MVCDLQIERGRVTAMVCGSELYRIKIAIKPLAPQSWATVKRQCAGQIGSLIELLQGRLSESVMEIITRPDGGLFPKPGEIELDCSCPDWADMCKHVAAALYGAGARLDEQPELLFVLRNVNHLELITQAADVRTITRKSTGQKIVADDQLSEVFGIELEPKAPNRSSVVPVVPREQPVKASRRKPVAATSEATAPQRRRRSTKTVRRASV